MRPKTQNAEAIPGWLLHLLEERKCLTEMLQRRYRLLVQANPDVAAANQVSLEISNLVQSALGLSKRESPNPYALVETILTLPPLYLSSRCLDNPERALDHVEGTEALKNRLVDLVGPLELAIQRRLA